jgi:hypothetical protein
MTTTSVTVAAPTLLDEADLNCAGPIDQLPQPPHPSSIVGGAVALETSRSSTSAAQTSLTQFDDPARRLFSKAFLAIRTDAVSELIVPDRWLGHLAFQWNSPEPTTHLRIGPCPGAAEWMIFPGGYLVSEVGCYDFVVRSGGTDETVQVGIGAPCEGQNPPDGPTES